MNFLDPSPSFRSYFLMKSSRLDLLNAALSLQNEIDERKKKKRARSTPARKKTKKEKKTTDATYHFIAYVPIGRSVWQLDGLEVSPVRIGTLRPNSGFLSKRAN